MLFAHTLEEPGGLTMIVTVSLARLYMPTTIQANMENDPFKFNSWGEFMYKLLKELDPKYVAKDGDYSIIRLLVLSGAGLILTAFLVGVAAVAFGKIHLGS